MKKLLLFIVFALIAFSCQLEEDLIPPISISTEINAEYLLIGELDLFLQNDQVFRHKGKPGVEVIQIGTQNLELYEECFVLYIASGSESDGTVSSAIIEIDGQELLNTSDFSNIYTLFTFEICNINEDSYLEVEIRGEPGSYLDIWIEGKLKGDINDGLIAYYPFNGNADDESGNGNHGLDIGVALTTDRFDTPNSAYEFDGDDYIEIDNWLQFTDVSFSFWVKYLNTEPASIISKRTGGWGDSNNDWQISSDGGGLITAYLWGTQDQAHETFSSFATGEWIHIVVIYNGSEVSIYRDNSIIYTGINSGVVNDRDFNTRIGDDWWGSFFVGKIDDIRIYNRALSDIEISILFHEGSH